MCLRLFVLDLPEHILRLCYCHWTQLSPLLLPPPSQLQQRKLSRYLGLSLSFPRPQTYIYLHHSSHQLGSRLVVPSCTGPCVSPLYRGLLHWVTSVSFIIAAFSLDPSHLYLISIFNSPQLQSFLNPMSHRNVVPCLYFLPRQSASKSCLHLPSLPVQLALIWLLLLSIPPLLY